MKWFSTVSLAGVLVLAEGALEDLLKPETSPSCRAFSLIT